MRSVWALTLLATAAGGCASSSPAAPAVEQRSAACPEPALSSGGWRHRRSNITEALGDAHHAGTDPVVNPGRDAVVRGKFAYGPLSKDLEDEDVTLMVRTAACGPWRAAATGRTNDDGRVELAVPAKLLGGPGVYSYRAIVHGDGSAASGIIVVAPRGRQAVVFDIDGTLTTSDTELAKEMLFNHDPAVRKGASQLATSLAGDGHLIVYITGRPYFLRSSSRAWLRRHGFPDGILITTDYVGESRPSREHVGRFKLRALERLIQGSGLQITRAYGNAKTDICAYAEAGIAPGSTFILGEHGGKACDQMPASTPLKDYRDHLPNGP